MSVSLSIYLAMDLFSLQVRQGVPVQVAIYLSIYLSNYETCNIVSLGPTDCPGGIASLT